MINLLFGFTIASILSILIIPRVIKISDKKKLFDVPNFRKVHKQPISSLGGVAIFLSFMMVMTLGSSMAFLAEFRLVIFGLILLFLIGINDDLVGESAVNRLMCQIIVAALSFFAGFRIEGDYGLFGFENTPIYFDFILTILVITVLINAYNLIDGINGLAGSLGLLASGLFAGLFYLEGAMDWSFVAIVLAGSILGFLRFNFDKAQIFMGDNGSTIIGFLVSIFFIKFLNLSHLAVVDSSAILITSLSIIFIPVFDLFRVFTLRIFNGKSPFSADKNHLHHYLLNLNFSHKSACLTIVGFQFYLIIQGWIFVNQLGILNSVLLLFFTTISLVGFIQLKLQLMENNTSAEVVQVKI